MAGPHPKYLIHRSALLHLFFLCAAASSSVCTPFSHPLVLSPARTLLSSLLVLSLRMQQAVAAGLEQRQCSTLGAWRQQP
jgi:hypothetical protein